MFCRCGAPLCGVLLKQLCCKTEQDPKTCDGIFKNGIMAFPNRRKQVSEID